MLKPSETFVIGNKQKTITQKKNTTNENYILRKMGWKFCKILYIYVLL